MTGDTILTDRSIIRCGLCCAIDRVDCTMMAAMSAFHPFRTLEQRHARRRGRISNPSDRPHSPEHVRLIGTELTQLDAARIAEFRKEVDGSAIEQIPDFFAVAVRVVIGL
jgi:hypothetical protein